MKIEAHAISAVAFYRYRLRLQSVPVSIAAASGITMTLFKKMGT